MISQGLFIIKKKQLIRMKEHNFLPSTILWDFTKKCNLRCVYCYNDYSNEKEKHTNSILYGITPPSKQPDLSIEQIRQKILPQFKEMKVKSLCLSGGEPLLRFDDIINLAPDFYRIGLEEVLIDTNGTLLNQKRIELIKKAYKKIPHLYFSIPLDSLNPIKMAELRPPMKDILEKTQNSIKLVLKNKLIVTVETVINKVNFDELEAIINFSKKKGMKCFAEIYPIFSVGRAKDRYDLLLNNRELQEFDRLKIKNYGKCLTWDFMPFIPEKKVWEKIKNKARIAQITEGCIAGREYLQLDHAGNVYPCSFLRLFCGNLLVNSLKDIWENNKILIRFRNRQITGKCGICKYKQECGGCRARAFTETGDPYGGVESCEGGPNGHPLERIFTQKLQKIYKTQYLYVKMKNLFKKKEVQISEFNIE